MIRSVIKANAFDRAARVAVENGCAGDILILKRALPFQAGSRTCPEFVNKADAVVHGARSVEEVSQRDRTANRLIGDGRIRNYVIRKSRRKCCLRRSLDNSQPIVARRQ